VIGQQSVYCDIGSTQLIYAVTRRNTLTSLLWNKCTTSKLFTCQVTNGEPIWSAFYVVSQSMSQATLCVFIVCHYLSSLRS